MTLTIVTKPTEYPLTLAEAKNHLRIDADQTGDDALIDGLVAAATTHAENYLGRALCSQTWKLLLDCFENCIRLPLPPLQSITSVKYLDTSGTEQTLATSVYRTLGVGSEGEGAIERDYGQVWPSTYSVSEAVRITFVAGYANAGVVPQVIKQAMLLHLTALYEMREPSKGEWGTYDALMLPMKVWGFGA